MGGYANGLATELRLCGSFLFDDMQARYVQVKASGDDMDDPKLYVDSKPGRPPK